MSMSKANAQEHDKDKEKKTWDLISIASIPLIMTLGNSMLIPVLPLISRELHITSFQVSLLITVYAVVAILLIPIAGYLSDRYGRKKVIVPSLILTGIGGCIAAWAAWMMKDMTAYWVMLSGRMLQGAGASGAFPIVLPLVGDMFKQEAEVSKGLGMIETSNTFGKVLSPIAGSALALWLWFMPFIAIPVFCLISLLMVIFLVRTPKRQDREQTQGVKDFLQGIRTVLKERGRWLYAIFVIGGIAMFVIFGVLFYLSNILEDRYGIDGIWKGLVLAIPLGALCLASFLAGKWIGQNKKRMKWLCFAGLVLATASIFGIGWLKELYSMVGMLVISGIGIGVTLPCLDAMITEGIEKEMRGTISSLYSSMRFIGVSLGPPVVSLLMNTSHLILFLTIAGVCFVAGILSFFAIRPQNTEGSGKGGPSSGRGSDKKKGEEAEHEASDRKPRGKQKAGYAY